MRVSCRPLLVKQTYLQKLEMGALQHKSLSCWSRLASLAGYAPVVLFNLQLGRKATKHFPDASQTLQVTETQSENPISLGQQRTPQQTAIIAFTARYYSNLPFQDPQPTLLKEFLPGARSLGCNELQLLNHLHTIPYQKWKAAYAPMSSDLPIVPLLGKGFNSKGNLTDLP